MTPLLGCGCSNAAASSTRRLSLTYGIDTTATMFRVVDGEVRVERGYVRPEDESAVSETELEGEAESNGIEVDAPEGTEGQGTGSPVPEGREEDEEQGIKPIPDRLITELMAYRTLALRDALAQDLDVAFQAALHALCLKLFYRYTSESCLDIDVKSVVFGSHAPGLNDTAMAKAVDERHRRWSEQCGVLRYVALAW
jgi:ParB family chromosome partitioning protein